MDSMNASDIIPGSGVVVCTPNFTKEDSIRKPRADEPVPQADETVFQADGVSNEITINNPKISERKNSKLPAKERRPSLKRKKSTKEELPEKKKTNSLPVSQMVMESIKALKKRNGAPVQAILEHMAGEYKINAKLVKRYVTRYLLSAVQKGIVEQLSGAGDDERFKIRKAKTIIKEGKKLKANQKLVKAEKHSKMSQKLNDNEKKIKAKQVAKVERNQNKKKAKEEKVAKVPQ